MASSSKKKTEKPTTQKKKPVAEKTTNTKAVKSKKPTQSNPKTLSESKSTRKSQAVASNQSVSIKAKKTRSTEAKADQHSVTETPIYQGHQKNRLNTFFVTIGVLVVLALLISSVALGYISWNRHTDQYLDDAYSSLYGDALLLFETRPYDNLTTEEISGADDTVIPILQDIEKDINVVFETVVIPGTDLADKKEDYESSLVHLRNYVQGYQEVVSEAQCLADQNQKFEDTYVPMVEIIQDAQTPEADRLAKAKEYLPGIQEAYQAAADCIQVYDVDADIAAIGEYYGNLAGSDSLDDFAQDSIHQNLQAERTNIQETFLGKGEELRAEFKKFFDSYQANSETYEL